VSAEAGAGEPEAAAPRPDPTPGRIARSRAAVERATTTGVARAREARDRWWLVDLVWTAVERDRRSVGNVLAGAVAFRVFVFLLPMALALVVLIGIVRGFDGDAPARAAETLGMSSYLVDSVESAAAASSHSLWVLVPLALWAIYVGGRGTSRVLWSIHALAWGQPLRRPRSSLTAATAAFVLVVATVVLLGLTQWARAHAPGLGIGAALAGVVPFVVLWLVASRLLPHDPAAPLVALLPGALLVGSGLCLAHLASAYYLARRIAHASELYGSLGVAAAVLAWLYLIGRLMVASAMLNATLWERRSGRSQPPALE
jgi:uncharacterized BrkB/YihY/UPF0761 family membrane protein